MPALTSAASCLFRQQASFIHSRDQPSTVSCSSSAIRSLELAKIETPTSHARTLTFNNHQPWPRKPPRKWTAKPQHHSYSAYSTKRAHSTGKPLNSLLSILLRALSGAPHQANPRRPKYPTDTTSDTPSPALLSPSPNPTTPAPTLPPNNPD